MENRMISLERNTNETQIDLTLDLDGSGRYEIDTGCGFLNHMLELFARHGRFDLVLTCHGDVEVDYHHTTEDVGIALGQAFARTSTAPPRRWAILTWSAPRNSGWALPAACPPPSTLYNLRAKILTTSSKPASRGPVTR